MLWPTKKIKYILSTNKKIFFILQNSKIKFIYIDTQHVGIKSNDIESVFDLSKKN